VDIDIDLIDELVLFLSLHKLGPELPCLMDIDINLIDE
jgi:hypothetical protein